MENPIMKRWRRMKSFGHTSSSTTATIKKSKSWNGSVYLDDAKITKKESSSSPPPPHGCFTVCVGPTKQRIVVKTKLVNHPLFKNLLEDAETEYGYRCDGPIVLPCEVDFFFKVLADMKAKDCHGDDVDYDDDDGFVNHTICGMRSPYRCGGIDSMGMRRNGSYKLLRTPSLFKLNRF